MRFPQVSSLLLAAALLATPTAVIADPVASQTSEVVASVRTSEAVHYAAREAKDNAVQTFQGGSEVIEISGSVLGLVLLIVIIAILL